MAVTFQFTLDDEDAGYLLEILRDHVNDLRTKAWQGGFSDAQAKMLERHAKNADKIRKIVLDGNRKADSIEA